MATYFNAYVVVLKKNSMLVMMVIVLSILTYAYWLIWPAVVISGSNVPEKMQNPLIIFAASTLCSLFFCPINVKAAQALHETKQQSALLLFCKIQMVNILFVTCMLCLIILTIAIVA